MYITYREGHPRDLMRCARRPKALPRCHIRAFIPAHLRSQIFFHRIHVSAFMPPHSSRTVCTYAAAFTPHLCSSIDAAALKLPRPHCTYSAALMPPPHLCSSSRAAAFLPQHSCRLMHGATSMQQLSRPCIHAAALFRSSHAAALMPSYSRRSKHGATFMPQIARRRAALTLQHNGQHWYRRSHAAALVLPLWCCSIYTAPSSPPHFSVAASRANLTLQHSAVAFTLPLAHRRIFAVFEKGCFGVGWGGRVEGGILCTYISLKGVCDGRVKNGGWGAWIWAKRDPIWAKSVKSGQKRSRIGPKKSIIWTLPPDQRIIKVL